MTAAATASIGGKAAPAARPFWPARGDPRWVVAAILVAYVGLGITVLGFNRSVSQIAITVGAAVGLDLLLHRLLRRGPAIFPLSAFITGLGLSILVNYAHGPWLAAVPAVFAIGSKYAFTLNGKHVYNPALFGVIACLIVGDGLISDAPSYQWGGSYAVAAFIATLGIYLFVLRIGRTTLVVSFLVFYALALLLRAWVTRWHMPMETWLLGAASSPSLYLFSFFMITDPQTSPPGRRAQIGVAACIVGSDLVLHLYEALSTLFYAAFLCATLRFLYGHLRAFASEAPARRRQHLRSGAKRLAALSATGLVVWLGVQGGLAAAVTDETPPFVLTPIDSRAAGIAARQGDVMQQVDPRIDHIAKWMLSAGDAVAVADVDNDGLQDLFFTYTLKDAASRAALYRNRGDFTFERIELPAVSAVFADPRTNGLPAAAIFFDWDNDGDQDLLISVGYGHARLFRNRLVEDGKLSFEDISEQVGLTDYGVSIAATVADLDRDGRLDIVLGSAFAPRLAGYAKPTRLNVFALPAPAYADDRRMFDFMHRSWHDANNGGGLSVLLQRDGRLQPLDAAALDLVGEHRWTNAVGIADLNGDGWPDIYVANDFGPDQLLVNQGGGRFKRVRSALVGGIGHDTYKGMNVSIADFAGRGQPGIYVSNVHEQQQAEGSMLWELDGNALDPAAWSDQAMRKNALNERRFGWGAGVGDLDLDGRLDILQANGMVDNAYDSGPRDTSCPDYWYWNDKMALTRPDVHGLADRWADLRQRCIFPSELDRVYLNRGNHFIDAAAKVGWTRPGNARGIALVDLDNDGDLDVVVTHLYEPASIWRNDRRKSSPAANWLGLQLQGDGQRCNRDAIGTQVRIDYREAGVARTQWREVMASNGFAAQSDRRLLFGLGQNADAVQASVRWCGAATAQLLTLQPGRYHRIAMAGAAASGVPASSPTVRRAATP